MSRFAAGVLLTFGLLAGAIALGGFALQHTVFNTSRVVAVADNVYKSPPAQDALANKISDELAQQMPGVAEANSPILKEAGKRAVADPAFQATLDTAVAAIQQHIVQGTDQNVQLDITTVTNATINSLQQISPVLGGAFQSTHGTITVPLDTSKIPSIHGHVEMVRAVTALMSFLAILLVSLGIFFNPDKPDALARVGRWFVGYGVVTLLLTLAIPAGLAAVTGGWVKVIANAVKDLTVGLRAPAIGEIVLGIAVITGASVWRRQVRKQHIPATPSTTHRSLDSKWQPPRPGTARV